jgi:ferritin-like metal-binding protein YciE
MNDLKKLFVTELEDMYDGEQRLVKALSEMVSRLRENVPF